MEESDPVFVKLENPSSIRKDVLDSAVEAARALKSYEDLLKVREEKTKKLGKLNKLMNKVESELRTLKRKTLPNLNEVEHLAEGKKIDKRKLAKRLPKTKKKTVHEEKVDDLDEEISDIKLKLTKLGI